LPAKWWRPARASWPPTNPPAPSQKRFDKIGVENTEDNRRDYRELLFRTDTAMKSHIGGVILFDETIRQKAKDGTNLVADQAAGSIPGIKVDAGAKPLAGSPGETVTEGLDGLRERLKECHSLGARFAKWRAVIDIGAGIPSLQRHQRQRPCPGPLCRTVPGKRHRADRRAGSADGRRP
jgi:fructose-bisphosphate aldolase class 1